MYPRVEMLDHGLVVYLVLDDTARLLSQRLFASAGSSSPELQLLSGVSGQDRVVTIQSKAGNRTRLRRRTVLLL